MYDYNLLFRLSFSCIFHVIYEDSSHNYTCINQENLVLYNVSVLGYIFSLVNYSLKSWNWLHCSLQDIGCTVISYWTIHWVHLSLSIITGFCSRFHNFITGIGLLLSILSSGGTHPEAPTPPIKHPNSHDSGTSITNRSVASVPSWNIILPPCLGVNASISMKRSLGSYKDCIILHEP